MIYPKIPYNDCQATATPLSSIQQLLPVSSSNNGKYPTRIRSCKSNSNNKIAENTQHCRHGNYFHAQLQSVNAVRHTVAATTTCTTPFFCGLLHCVCPCCNAPARCNALPQTSLIYQSRTIIILLKSANLICLAMLLDKLLPVLPPSLLLLLLLWLSLAMLCCCSVSLTVAVAVLLCRGVAKGRHSKQLETRKTRQLSAAPKISYPSEKKFE